MNEAVDGQHRDPARGGQGISPGPWVVIVNEPLNTGCHISCAITRWGQPSSFADRVWSNCCGDRKRDVAEEDGEALPLLRLVVVNSLAKSIGNIVQPRYAGQPGEPVRAASG